MKVISPVSITSGMVTSTTAVETVALWSSATTYTQGQRVRFGDSIYESLQNSNTNRQPDLPANATWWLRLGPTNRWAMFDNSNSTKTTATSPLEVTVQFTNQIINSLAFFGLSGNSLRIQVQDTSTSNVVFDQTFNLDDTIILDWYMYFFEPYDFREDLVALNVPPYANTIVTVTLTGGGDVSIGTMVAGNLISIGQTQYGVNVGIRDFSIKETDNFGNTNFVRRAFSKRMIAPVYVDNKELRYVNKVLTELRAIPAVWIGSEESTFEPTVIYGFYRDFTTEISYPTVSQMNLELEGLS